MPDTPSEEGVPETDELDFNIPAESANAVETLVEDSADELSSIESIDTGAIFETLVDPGHRYVLMYLLQSEGEITCRELVDYIVQQTDHTMEPEVFRELIVSKLTNTYLPDLAESGFVRYNMERQIVGLTELTPLVRPYLQIALAQQESVGQGDET